MSKEEITKLRRQIEDRLRKDSEAVKAVAELLHMQ